MADCPKCRKRLVRVKTGAGAVFRCPSCGGRAVGLSVLRKAVPLEYVKTLWINANRRGAARGQTCPICNRATAEVPVPVDGKQVALDVCARCQFVWFDASEFENLPTPPRVDKKAEREKLPEKVREAMAVAEMKRDEIRQRGSQFGDEAPDDPWKYIPALFGMPVEHDANPIECWPWVTWGLTAIMALTFLFTFNHLMPVIEEFGLIPNLAMRHGGVTFLTSFFLHAGLLHLVGNAYFLLIFGDNVENHIGPWRFLMLVVAAALLGDLLHMAADPRGMIPCVGASGGISGVIVFYALNFPNARLGFMIRLWYVFRWFYMPAWTALIAWLLLQSLLAYMQLSGTGNVSAMAHLGGATVGLIAWLAWREKPRRLGEVSLKDLRLDPKSGKRR